MPDFIWVSQSNQYDDNVEPIRDPQCTDTQALLTCPGHPSILFDGVIGADDEPQGAELWQYYTWRQEFTPIPYIGMSFDPPLEELLNITLYFYHTGGQIQAVITINICFSRPSDFDPCNYIEVPQLPDPSIGVVVSPVKLPTNTTSVTYLGIDMVHLHPDHEDDYIFLSEIRVAERLQGSDVYIIGCSCNVIHI